MGGRGVQGQEMGGWKVGRIRGEWYCMVTTGLVEEYCEGLGEDCEERY